MLGKRIKSLRKDGKITQSELSRVLGVSKSAVSMYESSKRQPEYDVLCRIAGFFNVSVDYLLGREREGGENGYELAVTRANKEGITEGELLNAIDFIIRTKAGFEGDRSNG